LVAFGAETVDGLDEENFAVCHGGCVLKVIAGWPDQGLARGIFRWKDFAEPDRIPESREAVNAVISPNSFPGFDRHLGRP
jgi:hypothetical protein